MAEQEQLSDEQALLKIAQAMSANAPKQDEKQNVHTFLFNIVTAKDSTKIGNLQVDKTINELGIPINTVRGCKEMKLIAGEIMDNTFFSDYFKEEAENTLATSLSREGFLVRQGTTQTKQIADITRRKKVSKGFVSRKEEISGGEPIGST